MHETMNAVARRKFLLPLKIIIPENPSITSNRNDQTIQKKKKSLT
jgi:hypothetical protein